MKFEDIVENAIDIGLTEISITDHNTIELYKCENYYSQSIHIVPGLEYTVNLNNSNIDLLFYGDKILDTELNINLLMEYASMNKIKLVIPHPFRNPTGLLFNYCTNNNRRFIEMCIKVAQGVEILNGKDSIKNIQESLLLVNNSVFDAEYLMGSDSHYLEDLGKVLNIKRGDDSIYGIKSSEDSRDIQQILDGFSNRGPEYFGNKHPIIYSLAQLLPNLNAINKFKSVIYEEMLSHGLSNSDVYNFFELKETNTGKDFDSLEQIEIK